MRLVALIATFVLGSAFLEASEATPFESAPRNLTEAEVRALPAGTKFEEIEKRLRYFARSAVAIPMISFTMDGPEEKECVMLFEDDTGLLLYALLQPPPGTKSEEAAILWPALRAGQRASDLLKEIYEKKEGEQGARPNASEPPQNSGTPPQA